jgi:hypothetical protein
VADIPGSARDQADPLLAAFDALVDDPRFDVRLGERLFALCDEYLSERAALVADVDRLTDQLTGLRAVARRLRDGWRPFQRDHADDWIWQRGRYGALDAQEPMTAAEVAAYATLDHSDRSSPPEPPSSGIPADYAESAE